MAQSKRWRAVVWLLGMIIAVLLLASIGLQMAINRNGPAVLNAVDRLAGGARNVVAIPPIAFGPKAGQKVHVYRPEQERSAPLPVLLFVHGGSWSNGSPDDYDFIARSFVPEGFVTVLAGYRMFPDAVFPSMLEDAASALAWTKANIAEHGGNPEHIVLAGHSAGAYNVVMATLDPQWLAKEGLSRDSIAGVVGLAGPYDFYPFDSDSAINSFGPAANPQSTQPVNFTAEGSPPMLLIHGETDTVVYPRNTIELAKRLRQAGSLVQTQFYPDMDHSAPLTRLASPWRGRTDLHQITVDFARNPLQVQGQTGTQADNHARAELQPRTGDPAP